MPRTVLLPHWEQAPTWTGLIGKVFDPGQHVPGPWKPRIEDAKSIADIEAFAFPTPFAWAEMMATVLTQGLYEHPLFKLYQSLVLGVTLGYLQLEVVDLTSFAFGKVLADTDSRYRYFGLLRGSSRNREIQGSVFGGTSPATLFWPSPRPSEREWAALGECVSGVDGRLDEAYRLLADLRELLAKAKKWDASDKRWMSGLNRVIGDRAASHENVLYHLHSCSVGPVKIAMGDEMRPLYMPVYQERFSQDFLRAVTGTFKLEGDRVTLSDDRNVAQFEITVPVIPTDGDLVLAGTGNLVPKQGQVRSYDESVRIRLNDDDRGKGLFSYLQPIHQTFRAKPDEIRERPFFYPDTLRLIVDRLGDAGIPGSDVVFSDRAYAAVLDSSIPRLPLASSIDQTENARISGFVLTYTDGRDRRQRKAVYVESYSGVEGGVDVGDLRAVGWVLWSYFIGAASYDGQIRDDELTPLLDARSGVPFASAAVHKRLTEQPDEWKKCRRLAALQRFVRAYQTSSEKEHPPVQRLCAKAADAFANCAWNGRVIPNGRPSRKTQEVQAGQVQFVIYRDEA